MGEQNKAYGFSNTHVKARRIPRLVHGMHTLVKMSVPGTGAGTKGRRHQPRVLRFSLSLLCYSFVHLILLPLCCTVVVSSWTILPSFSGPPFRTHSQQHHYSFRYRSLDCGFVACDGHRNINGHADLSTSQHAQKRRRNVIDNYGDFYDEDGDFDDDFDDIGNNYRYEGEEEEEEDFDDDYYSDRDGRGGQTADFVSRGVEQQEEQLQWETCVTETAGMCHVLLPPEDDYNREPQPPVAVLHFAGGTLFGSAPTVWYRRLLEDLVTNTRCAVVASTIPVTILQASPLQHVRLARQLGTQLDMAWRTVLIDEYGSQAMATVPVCGVGHSLGARILVVLATLKPQLKTQPSSSTSSFAANAPGDTNTPSTESTNNSTADPATSSSSSRSPPTDDTVADGVGETIGRRRAKKALSRRAPNYNSFVLMSFTNYGAAAGIPGIFQLLRASRRVEQRKQEQQQKSTNKAEAHRQRSRKNKYSRTRRPPRRRGRRERENDWFDGDDDDYLDDDYLDDDDDWGEIFQELQEAVTAQAERVQTALTPNPSALEFTPTPDQLWKALRDDGRYTVPQTLVVQFDDDDLDQSSLLATALAIESNSSDVRFARLRGTHLSPISIRRGSDNGDGDDRGQQEWLQSLNSKVSQSLFKIFWGKRPSQWEDQVFRDLRQTIARYTTEIVTKEL